MYAYYTIWTPNVVETNFAGLREFITSAFKVLSANICKAIAGKEHDTHFAKQ